MRHPSLPGDGRTDTLPGACVGCSACVTACPVAASDAGFAGPKVLGPALARRMAGGWPGEPPVGLVEIRSLGAGLCLQCHQCDLACPSGLPVSSFVLRAKAMAFEPARGAFGRYAENLVADQERFGCLAARLAGPRRVARAIAPRLALGIERAGLALLGLSPERSLPAPPATALSRWVAATRRPELEQGRPAVAVFAGCHARFHDPAAGVATVKVLRAAGYRVVIPPQVCCGSPAHGAGRNEQATRAAAANVRLLGRVLERLAGGAPVVSPCPSCTLALREHLPTAVPGPAARSLAARVWDLGEFLAGPARAGLERAIDQSPAVARTSAIDQTSGPVREEPGASWVYHQPCHLRALGVGRVFPALIGEYVPARPVDPGPAADGCCGMAGLSGLEYDGQARSLVTGAPVLEAYRSLAAAPGGSGAAGGPPTVLSDCPACRWQIADATGLPTAHPVELLARRL